MTTIAYRDGVLAGDGRTTNSDWVCTDAAVKVRKLRDGRLFGFTGDTNEEQPFLDWLSAGGKAANKPKLDGGRAIIISADGRAIWLYEKDGRQQYPGGYHAWGTGMAAALAAMDAGADAVTAVKIASRRDIYTGGRIRSVRIG